MGREKHWKWNVPLMIMTMHLMVVFLLVLCYEAFLNDICLCFFSGFVSCFYRQFSIQWKVIIVSLLTKQRVTLTHSKVTGISTSFSRLQIGRLKKNVNMKSLKITQSWVMEKSKGNTCIWRRSSRHRNRCHASSHRGTVGRAETRRPPGSSQTPPECNTKVRTAAQIIQRTLL